MSTLTVVRSGLPLPPAGPGELVVPDDEFRRWITGGGLVRRLRRYDDARLVTERLATSGRPMIAWALRLAARERCYIVDAESQEREITAGLLVRWSWRVAREAIGRGGLLRRIERELDALDLATAQPSAFGWNASARPMYLRTDLSFSVRAGGSVGHIAGVLNELARDLPPPVFLTTAPIPTLGPGIEVRYIPMPEAFWNFRELPTLVLNDVARDEAVRAIGTGPISMVYQRYSLNNFTGLQLARRYRVPLVLEYNGSEIWMSRHWSRPLKYESLAARIEWLNVDRADLVVVVSRPMRDELVARGVAADRILVNPNAVDPERYRPDVDGTAVRSALGLAGRTVIGFVSTFQIWHGGEVLAAAFVELLHRRPELRDRVRLLMIGNGPRFAATRRVLADAGVEAAVFTGLIEQDRTAEYLAACDILASPHVPNPDGTAFFGSPTKLFEYMAMGRGIVASALDQIGEVLRDGETALLVRPADVSGLAAAIGRLVDDPALARALGTNARRDALTHHTWHAHVRRTLEAVAARASRTAA